MVSRRHGTAGSHVRVEHKEGAGRGRVAAMSEPAASTHSAEQGAGTERPAQPEHAQAAEQTEAAAEQAEQPEPSAEPPEARVEPTRDDVDELVGPATPHFAMQIRARVRALVRDLPEDHPVRRYAEEKVELLERLAFASSKAEEGPVEPRGRPGWEFIPSHAPASDPLPPKRTI
jgi:hypothetical protein